LPGQVCGETAEKPTFGRLMENVHPAIFAAGRNWGPARRAGGLSEARTNREERGAHRSAPQ
jgi:hypothetical protein